MHYIQSYVEKILKFGKDSKCNQCECLQCFIEQVLADAKEPLFELKALKCNISNMHPCLACNDCKPAEEFTNYLKRK